MPIYDVIIVGGGFAGLTLARHLGSDKRVLILERKAKLNAAYESTGLVTNRTKELLEEELPGLKKFLTNDIDTIGVISTDFETNFFSSSAKPWVFSTDTPALIKALGDSSNSNVKIELGWEFSSLNRRADHLEVLAKNNGDTLKVKGRFVIGADGGSSRVAQAAGLGINRKFLLGYERLYPGKILLGERPKFSVYHYWFGEFSLGYGGWMSPTQVAGEPALRLGLAKLAQNGNEIKQLTQRFFEKIQDKGHLQVKGREIYAYAGKIPIGGPLRHYYGDRVLLLGDAAGLCGAFVADRIKGALVSARVAAGLLEEYFENQDQRVFRQYHRRINQHQRLMHYFRKQQLYRWIWNQMKRDSTFEAMFTLIARDKETFLRQFADAKNFGQGLEGIVLKPHLLPLLARYGALWTRDLAV